MFIQSFIETERSSIQCHDSLGEIIHLSHIHRSQILNWSKLNQNPTQSTRKL